ncbi:hypothetical protein PRZ48_014130 [Zasmidium cellare]|uniref:chitinase n=1 Tax=Zasmidium cellare TaxID=395010 RepID=A0ABR0E096_ZASCE|nr:hypothetical protein PRZ48_014130 [Zasmidium cellare]
MFILTAISALLAFVSASTSPDLVTQQDPAQLTPSKVDPRNHYHLQSEHKPSFAQFSASQPSLTPNGALKSPCGKYSEGGSVTEDYCSTTSNPPCQSGFGSCQVHQPYTCDPSAGSATKRSVYYYQGGNVYSRVCNQIPPDQIKLDGVTHLYWAFAAIDPNSFATVPSDSRDLDLYAAFTNIGKAGKVGTWISIGGFDYTTASATHTTFSDMVSTPANRQAFISGLLNFMNAHGFTGVDIDWEYPVDQKRGGRPNDMKNLVQLLADMRQYSGFGHNFGISVTLAPDLWYLQHYDAKGLLQNADFLGFMAYDLHGIWDVPNVGNVVLGQTNINDIEKDLLPLWFDLAQSDLAKVNFGLASYGRGYTLSNPACNNANGTCYWSGPSKPGPCTNTPGVMSGQEIKKLIADRNLTPEPLGDDSSTMVQITWDDQWMGFDDEASLLEKIDYANGHCFGGTMTWSVDLDSGTGTSETPPISTDGTCGIGDGSGNGNVSSDGTCGAGNNDAYCGGDYPGCCSSAGYCGFGDDYCGAANGEQPKFSSPSKEATDQDPNGLKICNSKPSPALWNEYKVGGYLYTAAVLGYGEGLVPTLVNYISGLNVFDCDWGTCDPNSVPINKDDYEECSTAPRAVLSLYAVAEYAKFWYTVSLAVNQAVVYLNDKAANMVQTFYPNAPNQRTPLNNLSTALSVVGAVLGLLPGIGSSLSAGASIGNAIVGIFATTTSLGTVDQTNITNSWGDMYKIIEDTLQNEVAALSKTYDNPDANSGGLAHDPGSASSACFDGTFSQDITRQISTAPLNAPDFITAVLASTAINLLWNQQQVVVAKASKASLDYDPCDGDTLFTAGTKYCDGQGNMYVLQLYNEGMGYTQVGSTTGSAVPGFPNLGDYFLTPKAITLASERSQTRSGFQAPPPASSDIINVLNDVDLNNVPLESVAAFNLPVCEMDGLNVYLWGDQASGNSPTTNAQLKNVCINTLVCDNTDQACLDKNGKAFPYADVANVCVPG